VQTTATFRLSGDATLTAEAVTRPLGILPSRAFEVHAGYTANWFCFIASHVTEHAAELDRQTLQRLLALPGDLWLDVCGETGHDGVS
jgi:hypothetical protein